MFSLRALFWSGVDCVFPWPTPLDSEKRVAQEQAREKQRTATENLISQLPSDLDGLKECLSNCEQLVQVEADRRQSTESRLTTIIGLSSIAGTIVLGTMLVPHDLPGVSKLLLSVGLLYLALQVSSAIHAAVRGLERRGYLALAIPDVIRCSDVAETSHLKRRITASLKMLEENQEHINDKVTWMATAHRAVINFVFGMLFVAGLGTWAQLTVAPQDPLLQRLRQDRVLRDFVRGPVGPQGPSGAPGSPGPPGKCTACKIP